MARKIRLEFAGAVYHVRARKGVPSISTFAAVVITLALGSHKSVEMSNCYAEVRGTEPAYAVGRADFNAKSPSPKGAKRMLTSKTRSANGESSSASENCFIPLRLCIFASLR